ncbi:HTH_48 domain-containing protein [Trichonephila clavipes]|nr:HTH_48 domain-containing protein [Trichonephila clavipes]
MVSKAWVIIQKEFVPPGPTVNQVFYKDALKRLRKSVIRVRPDIADKWMLPYDNTPCHTALSITEFLTSKDVHPKNYSEGFWNPAKKKVLEVFVKDLLIYLPPLLNTSHTRAYVEKGEERIA